MEIKMTETVFVKANTWVENIQNQQPANLAGDSFKAPVPVSIVSIPYKQKIQLGDVSIEREFVNVTDGIHTYRVLHENIKTT